MAQGVLTIPSLFAKFCTFTKSASAWRGGAPTPRHIMSQVLLVEPGAEDGEGGGVLRLGLPPHGAVLAAQGVRRQQDRQLQLDRLLKIARSHNELKQ